MRPAILAGSMAIPVESVDLRAVRRDLTISYRSLGAEEATEVLAYREQDGYIHVPRQYGLTLCRSLGIPYEDDTSEGVEINFNSVPEPRPYQVEPLQELEQKADEFYDFVFRARTGFGKTISSMILASRRGRTTIVVVDQENLLDQWVETLSDRFGMGPESVGIVRGKKCEWKDKKVVVAMVQTLIKRTYEPEFYRYFGTAVFDEVHSIGAPTFSQVLFDFHATFRIGVSATPKRKDSLQKLLDAHLGKIRVYVADAHDTSCVYVKESSTVCSWYANQAKMAGRYIEELTDDGARNLGIAESVTMLYESGRDTLVLSDRTEQLHALRDLCYYMGVPLEHMGTYTGETYRYEIAKDAKPKRRPDHLQHKAEYTPVKLEYKGRKTPKAERDRIKAESLIIFATYQMFSKGVDVARISGGVDASPRASSEQQHGRILRIQEGKPVPIWVTTVDSMSYRSLNQLVLRMDGYETNNAAIYLVDESGEPQPCDTQDLIDVARTRIHRLRSARIETLSDGRSTLPTRILQTLPDLASVIVTREPAGPSRPRRGSSPRGSAVKSPSLTRRKRT